MPTRFTKTRKHRGHVSAGYGRIGKHRYVAALSHPAHASGNIRAVVVSPVDSTTTALVRPICLPDHRSYSHSDGQVPRTSATARGHANVRSPDTSAKSACVTSTSVRPRCPATRADSAARNQYWRPVVNVDQLVSLVPEDQRKSATSELVPVVDVLRAGYSKVLGKGRLTVDMPLIVKARFVSRAAEAKCVRFSQQPALTLAGSRPRAASSPLSRDREIRCRTEVMPQ